MPRKIVNFALELEIKDVTCPGVWMCQRGKVSLIVNALESKYGTKKVKPIFPLKFHEILYFSKIFNNVNDLSDLKSALDNECITIDLIQWLMDCSCNKGRIISRYRGTMGDLLYSSSFHRNESINLLMERSKEFPGILSPKIEVITKIKIDESIDTYRPISRTGKIYEENEVNLKPVAAPLRQRNVCHFRNQPPKLESTKRNLSPNSHVCSTPSSSKICTDYQFVCQICSKYYKMFNIEPESCGHNKSQNIPAYRIPDHLLLSNKFDESVGDKLHQNLERIFSQKCFNEKKNYTECETYDDGSLSYDPIFMLKMFNEMNKRCLCNF